MAGATTRQIWCPHHANGTGALVWCADVDRGVWVCHAGHVFQGPDLVLETALAAALAAVKVKAGV